MKVCHFSDLHSEFNPLPPADLYICTGDMLPNFQINIYKHRYEPLLTHVWYPNDWKLGIRARTDPPNPERWEMTSRIISPMREPDLQRAWIDKNFGRKNFRSRYLGNPSAPVMVVRGNHDFIPLTPLFAGGPVWEVNEDPSRIHDEMGLRFGGIRGIMRISGEWSDELNTFQFTDAVNLLPRKDIDVLISHCPPLGILDHVHPKEKMSLNGHKGSRALTRYVMASAMDFSKLRYHFFGHAHSDHGSRQEGIMLFSNAATTHYCYDI